MYLNRALLSHGTQPTAAICSNRDTLTIENLTAWGCDAFTCRVPLFEIKSLLRLIDE
jgi:hypothetical protein